MITKTFVDALKHMITWFVNVYRQCFFQWGRLDTLSSWNPILDTLSWKWWLSHAQNATFGLFATASLFMLTGWFHIHLF